MEDVGMTGVQLSVPEFATAYTRLCETKP
jgi:hypothetical protein